MRKRWLLIVVKWMPSNLNSFSWLMVGVAGKIEDMMSLIAIFSS
jgi:hypothetical protein